jgi:hypothetical protein
MNATIKNLITKQNTSIQPSTIPIIKGGFENPHALSSNQVTYGKNRGIAVDSLVCAVENREGGEFILGNFLNHFP